MPNTDPPIHDPSQIKEMQSLYQRACGERTLVHMTAKLLLRTSPHDVYVAHQAGAIGFKLYPCGVTTNSDDGIPWIVLKSDTLDDVFAEMERLGMTLMCHGESDGYVMNREHDFVQQVLPRLYLRFPKLRLTLEHVTTVEGLAAVRYINGLHPGRVLGTITLHHLETTLTDVIGGKLRPDLFCKLIPKSPTDRDALLRAALSGESCFALGSDSAPHLWGAKYGPCGCAGVFTAPVLAQGVVSLFDKEFPFNRATLPMNLRKFTSENVNAFYGFKSTGRRITLERKPYVVPPTGSVMSYRAGETLSWSLVDV